MALKFFTISVRNCTVSEAELNSFLSAHRVLVVERRFVDLGENSFWSLCVDHLPSQPGMTNPSFGKKPRIDYRETLSPEDFALFAKLRDLRKQLAQREAVLVYTIFTNDQLAEMVRKKVKTPSELESIAGVGDGRLSKYGPTFLAALVTSGTSSETIQSGN